MDKQIKNYQPESQPLAAKSACTDEFTIFFERYLEHARSRFYRQRCTAA